MRSPSCDGWWLAVGGWCWMVGGKTAGCLAGVRSGSETGSSSGGRIRIGEASPLVEERVAVPGASVAAAAGTAEQGARRPGTEAHRRRRHEAAAEM